MNCEEFILIEEVHECGRIDVIGFMLLLVQDPLRRVVEKMDARLVTGFLCAYH